MHRLIDGRLKGVIIVLQGPGGGGLKMTLLETEALCDSVRFRSQCALNSSTEKSIPSFLKHGLFSLQSQGFS